MLFSKDHRRAALPSFDDLQDLVRVNVLQNIHVVLQNIHVATDPVDLDSVDVVSFGKTEVQPHPVVSLVPASAVDFVDLCQVAGHDLHTGAYSVAIGSRPLQADFQPVVSGRRLVSKQSRLTARVEHDHVHIAVIVEVIEARPAAAELDQHSVSGLIRYIRETPLSDVLQQDVAGVVGCRVIELIDVVAQVSACNKDISIAVVVEIEQGQTSADVLDDVVPA